MYKPSIYDRLSARREALQEQARLAELVEEASVPETIAEPEPVAMPAVMDSVRSSFTFAGFTLDIPMGFNFREIQTTLEHEDASVALTIRRRDVRRGQLLEQLFDEAIEALRSLNPQLRVIRQRDCFLAGSPAKVLDFHVQLGHEPRHGRLVGALVPVEGDQLPQWLELSTVIDPTKPGLSQWLAEFDHMLNGLALRCPLP